MSNNAPSTPYVLRLFFTTLADAPQVRRAFEVAQTIDAALPELRPAAATLIQRAREGLKGRRQHGSRD